MPKLCTCTCTSSLVYMALKWILQSVRALVATCFRMVLFYLIFFPPKPGTGSTQALGRGRHVWRWMRYLAAPLVPESCIASCILSIAEFYSPLTPAVFPPATPGTLPVRTAAAAVFVGLPAAAHTAPISRCNFCLSGVMNVVLSPQPPSLGGSFQQWWCGACPAPLGFMTGC